MRRLLATAFVIAACAAAAVLTAADEGGGALKSYDIVFDNAFGLVEGGDLKIGGVKAGQTTGFRLTDSQPYRTIVRAEVTVPGFDTLREDARCEVRAQSLIGEYFVDCGLGEAPDKIPDGGRVPVEQTASTIPPDLINDVMRRPYRDRFRLILTELGTGLAGRPDDLNEVIRRAHPGLRELTETLAVLRSQNKIISNFIRDADTVSAAVEPFKEDVARWAREAENAATIQASRSEELGRYYSRLPDFFAELRPTLGQLARTADAQIPTLRRLGQAAPELERFLVEAQPFARETRGSITALGEAAEAGSAAIVESREEISELRRLAKIAPALGKPLRQFLQTIDDRKRSIERDPAARDLAPPAPDKTAYEEGRGFTGMEALWNYFYYQTLSINSYDELGHLLRIVLFAGGPCAPYNPSPTPAEQEQCASWTGPNQPGVTTPDPSVTGEVAAREAAQRRNPPKGAALTTQRSAGDPEAPPVPGQRDISEPQIRMPDEIQGLLDRLRKPLGSESAPPKPATGADQDGTGQILDYLLSP